MEFYLDALLRTVAAPSAALLVGLLAVRYVCASSPIARQFGIGLAFGLAFVVGYVAMGWAPLVPTEAWTYLPYLVVLAGLLAPLPSRMVVPILAASAGFLLTPTWPEFSRMEWLYAVTASMLGLIIWHHEMPFRHNEHGPVRRIFPPELILTWLVAFNGAAVVLMLSGNAKFAQLAGIAASLLTAELLVAWLWPALREPDTVRPAIPILLAGLVWNAKFNSFSDVPLVSYLLVIAAPLAGSVVALPALQRRGPITRCIAAGFATLIPVALAVGLAWWATATDDAEW